MHFNRYLFCFILKEGCSLCSDSFQLAKTYHPDMNPDDPEAQERFAKVAEAYEVQNSDKQTYKYFPVQ